MIIVSYITPMNNEILNSFAEIHLFCNKPTINHANPIYDINKTLYAKTLDWNPIKKKHVETIIINVITINSLLKWFGTLFFLRTIALVVIK